MPRLRHRLLFSALAFVVASAVASAQDATKVAADAEKQIAEIQKLLAKGKDAKGNDNPLLTQLRVDGFKAVDDGVQVTGLFLDPGAKAQADAGKRVGDAAKDVILKHIGVTKDVTFTWSDVKVIGAVDDAGKPVGDQAPHILLQTEANAAGAKGNTALDQLLLDGSRFGPDGGLVVTGKRGADDAVAKWLEASLFRLEKHPAAVKGGKSRVTADVKAVDWKASAAEIQKAFAAAGKAAGTDKEKARFTLRRLLVERTYFSYEGASLQFHIEGFRIGGAAVDEDAADEILEPVAKDIGGKVGLTKKNMQAVALDEEPVKQLRADVSNDPALDGVRIDPGFTFGPKGELRLAGIQPGLPAADRAKLEARLAPLVMKAFEALRKGKTEEIAAKYGKVAGLPVSAEAMSPLPLSDVKASLRAWAAEKKEDLKIGRLYFPADLGALGGQHHVRAGGLVLTYFPVRAADVKDVEGAFKVRLEAAIPQGVPAEPGAPPGADAGTPPMDKLPLRPSLTAHIRTEMTNDQKAWYGVLIERGYFDPQTNRYTILGVVDSDDQNEKLAKLLDRLSADAKWKDYFEAPPTPPALKRIPMGEMLERVKRVTPAHPVFDGTRIVNARYEFAKNAEGVDELRLVFEAHAAGPIDRDAAPALYALLNEHEDYRRRLPPSRVVRVVQTEGPAYPDDQLANFSLAYGGKLLSKANASKDDKRKAKEWLDLAMLHHPNEAAVWFLSAYYNFAVEKDDELTRRDLYRVVDLEGPLAFNGPSQRKRRYEAARDLQGPTRNELEALWLDVFRDVKDGAKPITLKK